VQVWLKKKGLASANKKANRVAAEGVIETYIHAGANLGVLIEVNCETDFVAKGTQFKELAANLAMQVTPRVTCSVFLICRVATPFVPYKTS
jgi:elongation factor Ts